MNMRFSQNFEGLPERVQNVPQRWRRLSPGTRLVTGALLVLVTGATLYFVLGGSGSKERMRPPPVVVTAKATAKDVTVVEHTVGTVVANSTVQVTARVTGQLLRSGFQEGHIVRKGDLLFVIDPRPFQAALQQARAQLAKDMAQQVDARSTKDRYDRLFAQNAISVQQRDQADAAAKSNDATVVSDRAAVQLAELNLGYTQIRSPVDGKTGPILVQPGNMVTANAASPLVVVTQIEPVKVSFALPQSDLPRIQAREHAGLLTALLDRNGADGKRLQAPVDFVSNQVSDQTGTIELRATFDNRDHQLVPGQLVNVDVTLNNLKHATVVPREAVNDGPNGRYVYVVKADHTAEMRPVNVLFDDGTSTAVSGIRPKETVIVDGQLRVLPGAKVTTGKGRKSAKSP
jgi:multidrug efflux system membrane fusion protein